MPCESLAPSTTGAAFGSNPYQANPPISLTTTPVRVMYVVSDLAIGGAEIALYRLLAKTDRQRFEPVVVSLVNRGSLRSRIESLGIEVHTLQMKAGRPSLSGLYRLIKLVKGLRPKLIVGWMHHSCLAAELANWLARTDIPTIWSLHYAVGPNTNDKKLTILVSRVCAVLSKRPAKIVYVSNSAQNRLRSAAYRSHDSCVIPNGIDIERFAPSAHAHGVLRQALEIPEQSLVIGIVGRYHPLKNHADFLKAAALIAARQPHTHFVLIGRGVDAANDELVGLIKQLNLSDRVHLLGEHEDTAQLIAGFDVFALSSAVESCPNVVGEAMACGVPCVVTDVGDSAQIVAETGRVVPPGNVEALATGLLDLLALDAENRRALGIQARNRVALFYTIQRIVEQYENVYQEVINASVGKELNVVVSSGLAPQLGHEASP